MSVMRKRPFDGHDCLGSWLRLSVESSKKVSQRVSYLHFAHDSYIEQSVKNPERLRRCDGIEQGLDIIGMADDTPVPVNAEKFWVSAKNK